MKVICSKMKESNFNRIIEIFLEYLKKWKAENANLRIRVSNSNK